MPRIRRGPDFIMLGQPLNDGVGIYASTSLYQASYLSECDIEYEDLGGPYLHARPVNERHTISAVMASVTTAHGPDYPTALARLLGEWSPDPTSDSPLTLPPGRSLTP